MLNQLPDRFDKVELQPLTTENWNPTNRCAVIIDPDYQWQQVGVVSRRSDCCCLRMIGDKPVLCVFPLSLLQARNGQRMSVGLRDQRHHT